MPFLQSAEGHLKSRIHLYPAQIKWSDGVETIDGRQG